MRQAPGSSGAMVAHSMPPIVVAASSAGVPGGVVQADLQ